MAKTDVKSALRLIPIHISDYSMLDMKWQHLNLRDRCLPLGCSSSCAIFEACSTALEWLAMPCFRASSVLHILGDLLFIADNKEKESVRLLHDKLQKCRTLLHAFFTRCSVSLKVSAVLIRSFKFPLFCYCARSGLSAPYVLCLILPGEQNMPTPPLNATLRSG